MSDTEMVDVSAQEEQVLVSQDDNNYNCEKTPIKIRNRLEMNDTITSISNQDDPKPKISKLQAPDLRGLSLVELSAVEVPSEIYGEFFRCLQLNPDQWDCFADILRAIRNKHMGDLKRGSVASIRSLSAYLLRGYGYKIWHMPGSEEWLRDLEGGEERLVYERKGDNER
jgi:hypothetical protein